MIENSFHTNYLLQHEPIKVEDYGTLIERNGVTLYISNKTPHVVAYSELVATKLRLTIVSREAVDMLTTTISNFDSVEFLGASEEQNNSLYLKYFGT